MSDWNNSHSYLVQKARLLQYAAGGLLDQCRPVRMEAEISDDDVYPLPTTLGDVSAYIVKGRGADFCTKSNLLDSVAYINQEFQLLGLPCVKHDGTKCTSDNVFFINCLNDLLTLYHKTAAVKEDLEARNHRLACETDHHQSTAVRSKRLQEQTERELDQEREKTRQVSLKYSQVCNSLKSEKEEVRRLTAVLQSRDLQHKHEQKKKEREVHRLKERLHQLLADKVPDRKVGMDLMNVVSRRSEEGRRATWKTGPEKQEEEMYQILINNYEQRHQEMMQENGQLRDCLLSHQRELTALVKHTGDVSVLEISSHSEISLPLEDSEHSIKSCLSNADLGEGFFQMPYDIVRHEIERTFKEAIDHISRSIKKCHIRNVAKHNLSMALSQLAESDHFEREHVERRHACDTSEVDRLKKQISNYKAIILQQEDLIRQSISSHSQSMETSFLHKSQLLKEKENLSEQKKYFIDEKTNFEKERKAFTEAAFHLSKERQLLQEERAKLIKQHFLNISSFKENQHKKCKGDGPASRLLPATPVVSPAKSSNIKALASSLHSSTELDSTLGLSSLSGQILAQPDRQVSSSNSRRCRDLKLQQQSAVLTPDSMFTAKSGGSLTPPSSTCSPFSDVLTSADDTKDFLMNSTFQKLKSDDV